MTGVLTTTAATVFSGGFASNQESTIIAADGQADNAFVLTIKNQEATDDRSFGLRIEAGSTATDLPLNIETHDGGTALFQLAGNGQARFLDGTASLPSISNLNGPDLNTGIFFPAADEIGFTEGGVEAARFDSSGRLLMGNTANVAVGGHNGAIQLTGAGTADYHSSTLAIIGNSTNSNGAYITLASSRSNSAGGVTVVQDDDTLGLILFAGADGSDLTSYGATIGAFVDGTPGSDSMPSRLVFATTPADAAGSTNRMAITSTGRVGVGTITPDSFNSAGNHFVVSASGNAGITIDATSSTSSSVFFADGDSGTEAYRGYVQYNHGDDKMVIGAAAGTKFEVLANGNVEVTDGDLVIGTAGHGIDFSINAGSGGVESELLDDYETGTFTMTLGQVSAGSFGIGRYVKVGRLVHFQWYSNGTINVDQGAGGGSFTGLPFTTDDDNASYGTFSSSHNTYCPTAANGYINVNGTSGVFTALNTTGGAAVSTGTGKYVMVAGTYRSKA